MKSSAGSHEALDEMTEPRLGDASGPSDPGGSGPAVFSPTRPFMAFTRPGESESAPPRAPPATFPIMVDVQTLQTASLEALPGLVWALLREGVEFRRSPWRTPALATLSGSGEPDLRTVVLRDAAPLHRLLCCHTDWRSPKRVQMARHERVSWLFYDAERGLQLRARGCAVLHRGDDVARRHWQGSQRSSRMCYAAPEAPGDAVSAPPPAPEDPDGGWGNFTVVRCTVDALDFLHLQAGGHRRALLLWEGDAWRPRWVAP
jgi:hypothetical protein